MDAALAEPRTGQRFTGSHHETLPKRCLPPGGGAALAVVLGGEAVHGLGYAYLVAPLLLNVLILLTVAMLFNAPFPHRRHPLWLARLGPGRDAVAAEEKSMIAHSDLVYALSQIDTFPPTRDSNVFKKAVRRPLRPQSL